MLACVSSSRRELEARGRELERQNAALRRRVEKSDTDGEILSEQLRCRDEDYGLALASVNSLEEKVRKLEQEKDELEAIRDGTFEIFG